MNLSTSIVRNEVQNEMMAAHLFDYTKPYNMINNELLYDELDADLTIGTREYIAFFFVRRPGNTRVYNNY